MSAEKTILTSENREKFLKLGGGVRRTDDFSIVKKYQAIIGWDGKTLDEIGVNNIKSVSKDKISISGGYLVSNGKTHLASPSKIITISREKDKEYFIINNKHELINKARDYFSNNGIVILTYLDGVKYMEGHKENGSTLLKIIGSKKNGDTAILLEDIEGIVQVIDGKLKLKMNGGIVKSRTYDSFGNNMNTLEKEVSKVNEYKQMTIPQLRTFFYVNQI